MDNNDLYIEPINTSKHHRLANRDLAKRMDVIEDKINEIIDVLNMMTNADAEFDLDDDDDDFDDDDEEKLVLTPQDTRKITRSIKR